MTTRPPSGRRRFPARWVSVALSTVAVVGFLEGGARLLVDAEELPVLSAPFAGSVNLGAQDVFEFDPDVFWALRPNLDLRPGASPWADRTNSVRLRRRTEVAEIRNRLRVLCLGDSCTYGLGLGVDDAWPAQAESVLGGEFLNAAVPGYSAYQGEVLWRRLAPRLDPDCVVVQFGANDMVPWPAHEGEQVVWPTDVERARHFRVRGLAMYSRFAAWALSLGSAPMRPGAARIDTADFWTQPPRVPADECAERIQRIATTALGGGGGAVVVVWPRRSEFDSEHLDPIPPERIRAYRERILSLREAGAVVVDVLDAFRRSGMTADDLYLDDVHATRVGCRVAAQAIVKSVRVELQRVGGAHE